MYAYGATGTAAQNLLNEADGYINGFAEGIGQLADDYGWALKNPDAVLGELPEWVPGVTGPFGTAEVAGSPLVIDVDGDGIELSALNGTGAVYWDIDADGFREASGWIVGGDGLLSLDRNGNQRVRTLSFRLG